MLGLRRFRQTQIDLWQGDFKIFASDLACTFTSPVELHSSLKIAQTTHLRHVSIFSNQSSHVRDIITTLKTFLEQRDTSSHNPSRITIVASGLDIYDELQQLLFATFEDI